MELRHEHRKLALAIVVALDRSGSMTAPVGPGRTKMDLANLGAAQVLDRFGPSDEFGCFAEVGDRYTSLVRWAAGQTGQLAEGLAVTQEVRNGVNLIRLHLDPGRKAELFAGTPQVQTLKARPGEAPRAEAVPLTWDGPDTLAADVPLDGDETALSTVAGPGRKAQPFAPVRLPYSPEHTPGSPGAGDAGRDALERLARATGGVERVERAACGPTCRTARGRSRSRRGCCSPRRCAWCWRFSNDGPGLRRTSPGGFRPRPSPGSGGNEPRRPTPRRHPGLRYSRSPARRRPPSVRKLWSPDNPPRRPMPRRPAAYWTPRAGPENGRAGAVGRNAGRWCGRHRGFNRPSSTR